MRADGGTYRCSGRAAGARLAEKWMWDYDGWGTYFEDPDAEDEDDDDDADEAPLH